MSGSAERSSDEIVFGVVGAVGTDLELVTAEMSIALREYEYHAEEVRLSALLTTLDWDEPLADAPLDQHVASYMDAGNKLRRIWRRGDALALLALAKIADVRAEQNEEGDEQNLPLARTAFILRSLKHPDEVKLLRSIYGPRFFLVSAYSPRHQRARALREACERDYGSTKPEDWEWIPDVLIERDESEVEPRDLPPEERDMGQNVRDTFHRADYFLDASYEERLRTDCKRMMQIVFGHPFRTPTVDEYALFQAQGAAKRSAEPGRQVGAAIAGPDGTIIALGANEVPRAGGGTYWETRDNDSYDGREFCNDIDTNDRMKHEIAEEIVDQLIDDGWIEQSKADEDASGLLAAVERTRLGNLIEFGRAVHAEMDAILDAARRGASVQDATLFTTTFPCHNCARHIVGAGIRRVVYVAPYAKSLAKELHPDSIDVAVLEPREEAVPFEPFVGVAPMRYLDLFDASKRKEDDGSIVKFIPSEAMPRLVESEPDDLRPRQERYTQREEMALELLGEIFEGTTVALGRRED